MATIAIKADQISRTSAAVGRCGGPARRCSRRWRSVAGRTTERPNGGAFNAPSMRLATPFESPVDLASNLAERRRNHRSGTPSRISLDPELRAFMTDRPDRLTTKETNLAVAANFAANLRGSLSSTHR